MDGEVIVPVQRTRTNELGQKGSEELLKAQGLLFTSAQECVWVVWHLQDLVEAARKKVGRRIDVMNQGQTGSGRDSAICRVHAQVPPVPASICTTDQLSSPVTGEWRI